MASRTLSRRALRDQHDQAESSDQETPDADDTEESEPAPKKTRARKAAAKKPATAKVPAKPRARKKAVKVAPRMFARWAVCDGAFKRLALFEYKDRAGADAKLGELRVEKKGPFFVQLVKDPYDPPAAEVEAVPAV